MGVITFSVVKQIALLRLQSCQDLLVLSSAFPDFFEIDSILNFVEFGSWKDQKKMAD